MKGLSIKEKAKAYDKVREKIAVRFGSNVADEIFSQFEEPEDERIIKEIGELVESAPLIMGLDKDKIFAWLEKQRKKDEEILILKDQIESLHAARKALIEVHKIELKKQDEQWSEEDESMYIRTLGILGKCYMGELPTKVEEELNWFKSLKERMQPQPRQEWSEEDESTINDIICYIRQRLNYESEKGKKKIQKCENWLKSLRPKSQWKPSKEQIDAIKVAIAYMTDESETPTTPKVLSELLEQLKKLKGDINYDI